MRTGQVDVGEQVDCGRVVGAGGGRLEGSMNYRWGGGGGRGGERWGDGRLTLLCVWQMAQEKNGSVVHETIPPT